MPNLLDILLAPIIYIYYVFSIFVVLLTGIDIWSFLGLPGQGI